MRTLEDWPPAPALRTERLSLEPLRVDHAAEMAPLLDDPQLYVFTGGSPRTLDEASMTVARALGLTPSGERGEGGDVRWTG